MNNKFLIVIGLIIIALAMVMSFNKIINNMDVLVSGHKAPVNETEQEFMDNFTNQILSGKDITMDDYGNIVFDNTTVEEQDTIVRNELSASIDEENNTIRINRGSYYTIYTHDGSKITHAVSYIDFNSNDEAKRELAEVNKENLDANVKDIYVEDNRIVIEYTDNLYTTLTLEEVQITAQFYDQFKDMINK